MDAITEPATLVTDYLLAVFTATLAWKLYSDGRLVQRWWAVAFAATSVSGVAGGTVHGFQNVIPAATLGALWMLTLAAILVAAVAVMLATLAVARLSRHVRRGLTVLTCVVYGVYVSWVLGQPRFALAIAGYGAALVAVTFVHARAWLAARASESAFILAGVAVSIVAAAVQLSGWAPHPLFNHNDLFHVIQAGAFWLLYRGASLSVDPADLKVGPYVHGPYVHDRR